MPTRLVAPIQVKLTLRERREWQRAARRQDVSVSDLVRGAVREHLTPAVSASGSAPPPLDGRKAAMTRNEGRCTHALGESRA
jgi:hypothetical protein